MNSNTTIVLVAAAFAMIGFILGRITSHPAGHSLPPMVKEMRTMKVIGDGGEASSDIQFVIKAFEDGDFDGDTSFSIPGGRIQLNEVNGEMQVEVEMKEASVDGSETSSHSVVTKTIVVTSED
jgi:hypothetical protein